MSRYLGDDFLVPVLDPGNTPWFTSGELRVQFCNDCGACQFPPEEVCTTCLSQDQEFRPLSGEGTVESAVEVTFPVHPLLAGRVPYNVAVISLDGAPGCNAIGNVVNRGPREVAIGQRVRAIFEQSTDPNTGETMTIPNWEAI